MEKGKMKIDQLISIDEKRSFLKWFIGHYELKAKECIWLLNYIMNDDHIISLIRFVQTIDKCPRAMLISEKTIDHVPFIYRKESVETREPEKAYHDIRLNQDDPIYVQLVFKKASQCVPYLSVLEDQPFADLNFEELYGKEAEQVLTQSQNKFKLDHLYLAIDKALNEKDELAFIQLTNQLIDLQNRLKK